MSIRIIATALLVCLLAGAAAAQPAAQQYDVRFMDGLQIPSNLPQPHGPITIAANAWVPTAPGQRFPLIILPNSWGMDEYEYRYPAQQFAKQGYVALSYSARGWAKTNGQVDVAGPADAQDVSNIIDWALQNLPVDPSRIGMAGISYGAGTSLIATAHDPRIKAVAAMSGWANLLESLDNNNTPAVLWTKILESYAKLDGATLDSKALQYLDDLADYQIVPEMRDWALRRSAGQQLASFNNRQVAVFLSNNLEDYLFLPTATWDFYCQLTGPKRMLLNQGQHAAAEQPGLQGKPNHVWDEVHAWMDRYLEGSTTTNLSLPGGLVMLQPFGLVDYIAVDPSDSMQVGNRTFTLTTGPDQVTGGLQPSSTTPPPAFTITPGASGAEAVPTTLPILEAVDYLTHPFSVNWVPLSRVDRTHAAVFVTDPVPASGLWRLRGTPTLSGTASLNGPPFPQGVDAQFVAYLYDVGLDGVCQLVTFGPMTIMEPQQSSAQPINITMRMTGWDLAPGHRLALILGTGDPLYDAPASSWHVPSATFPSVTGATLTVPMQTP